MDTRRVALYYSRHLLGESLELLLNKFEDVELLGPWLIEQGAIDHLAAQKPDLVMVIDEQPENESASELIARLLENYAGLPVIQVTLEPNLVRVYNSHTLPASSEDLIGAIRNPQGQSDPKEVK